MAAGARPADGAAVVAEARPWWRRGRGGGAVARWACRAPPAGSRHRAAGGRCDRAPAGAGQAGRRRPARDGTAATGAAAEAARRPGRTASGPAAYRRSRPFARHRGGGCRARRPGGRRAARRRRRRGPAGIFRGSRAGVRTRSARPPGWAVGGRGPAVRTARADPRCPTPADRNQQCEGRPLPTGRVRSGGRAGLRGRRAGQAGACWRWAGTATPPERLGRGRGAGAGAVTAGAGRAAAQLRRRMVPQSRNRGGHAEGPEARSAPPAPPVRVQAGAVAPSRSWFLARTPAGTVPAYREVSSRVKVPVRLLIPLRAQLRVSSVGPTLTTTALSPANRPAVTAPVPTETICPAALLLT